MTMKQTIYNALLKAWFVVAAIAISGSIGAQQLFVYDFVWYSGAAQTWVYDAGPKFQVEVYEDSSTPENDVYFRIRNGLDTALAYESNIRDIQIDLGTDTPDIIDSISIAGFSDGIRYYSYPPGDPQTLIDLAASNIAWTGDYAVGRVINTTYAEGINPGEFVVLKATLKAGLALKDLVNAMNTGMSTAYVDGHFGELNSTEKQLYRAGAPKGLRIAILVHSIVPNTWNPDGHGLFVTHKLLSDAQNSAPQITTLSATPSTILDTESSQLTVAANDPDGGPSSLSYAWTVQSGGGTLSDATSANPVYTPADVFGNQTVVLRVDISDGATTASGTISLSVSDANPPPPTTELFSTTFGDKYLTGWTVHDEGTVIAPSKWMIANYRLFQNSNIHDGGTSSDLARLGTYLSYDDGLGWTDYRLKFTMLTTADDDVMGVMFRLQNADNYYRFTWDKQRGQRRLVKKSGGAFTLLAADNLPYTAYHTYRMEIVVRGNQIEVWIDGARIFQVFDTAHAYGTFAFHTWQNNYAYFDDARVEDLSGGTFNAAPKITSVTATPSDILDTESSKLTVAAYDPNNGPETLSYEWTVLSGGGEFDDATSANPTYVPSDLTSTESVKLRVQVSDGAITASSDLNITVRDADAPPVGSELLAENFRSGSLAGWTVHDEGTVIAPSKWTITNYRLFQNSNINDGGTTSDLARLGTYLSYDDGSGWTDYRLKFTMLTTADDDVMGVMFRLQNADNYYRFTWDKQRGQRRLVKKTGGTFTLLAADSVPYAAYHTYRMEIMVLASAIEVWIDGVRIFRVNDADHAYGTFAFHSWQNNYAYFDDVVVNAMESR